MPAACPSCDDEQLRYVAFVPARVAYEGKRADRARSSTELHEDGFHGYRVDCRDCGTVAALTDGCPLCEAAGPLRAARASLCGAWPLALVADLGLLDRVRLPQIRSRFAISASRR